MKRLTVMAPLSFLIFLHVFAPIALPSSIIAAVVLSGAFAVPVVVLLCASVMWGVTWLPLKFFHRHGAEGLVLISVAFSALTLVYLPLLWRRRRLLRQAVRPLLLIAVLGGFANLAFNSAMMYGDVVRVMVLFYLVPVWSVLGGRFFLGETVDRLRLVSVVLALLGVFVMVGGWKILDSPLSWQDMLGLGAGFTYAMTNVVFRATPALPLTGKIGVMAAGCSLGGLVLLALGVQPVPSLDAGVWGGMILMGLVWYLLATLGSQWAVTQLEAGQVGVIMVSELIAAVVSAVLLGESDLTALKLAGVVCVLVASLLESRRPRHPVTSAVRL